MVLLEGIAGSGKSTLRNRLLSESAKHGVAFAHLGQFSWLSLEATRKIVRLRQGSSDLSEADAIEAMCTDLSLHFRFNIATAMACGGLVIDRLVLSSATLLAAIYGGDVRRFLQPLSEALPLKPKVTVVLTTEPELCWRRIQSSRRSSTRFVESREMIKRLYSLMQDAAEDWASLSGGAVILRDSATSDDIDTIVLEVLGLLRNSYS